MSRIHFEKRRDFLKGAACFAASGAASTFVPQLSMMGTALAQSATGYKALVCIYLDGGNDAWNLLIPVDNSTQIPVPGRSPLSGQSPTPFGWYVTSRGGYFTGNPAQLALTLPNNDLGPNYLPPSIALNGGQYAVNPAVPELASLYNSGRLSFVANVGPLVEPLRRQGFNNFRRPPQLYSHNDQTSLWQIGGGSSSSDANGWGGRTAGRLLGQNPANGLSPCISVAGQTRFLVGQFTQPNQTTGGQTVFPYRLSTSNQNPATSLSNYAANNPAGSKRLEVLESLVAATYPQAMTDEYGDIVSRSLNLSSLVNNAITQLGSLPPFTAAPPGFTTSFIAALNAIPNTGVGNQLRQVARMIAVSRAGTNPFGIQANRQIYFVRTGGYDTHDGQIPASRPAANGQWSGHQRLLQEVSQAMSGFNTAMNVLNAINVSGAVNANYTGVVNEVVTFTMSEFARTINSNGNGTDHAWGSVGMVMGGPGALTGGGQVFGRYPLQLLNRQFGGSADALGECFSRGEFLPTTAVDQYAATLARWVGLTNADVTDLFPNIDNYSSPRNGADGVMAFSGRVIPNMLAGIT